MCVFRFGGCPLRILELGEVGKLQKSSPTPPSAALMVPNGPMRSVVIGKVRHTDSTQQKNGKNCVQHTKAKANIVAKINQSAGEGAAFDSLRRLCRNNPRAIMTPSWWWYELFVCVYTKISSTQKHSTS